MSDQTPREQQANSWKRDPKETIEMQKRKKEAHDPNSCASQGKGRKLLGTIKTSLEVLHRIADPH